MASVKRSQYPSALYFKIDNFEINVIPKPVQGPTIHVIPKPVQGPTIPCTGRRQKPIL
jgi:hypothetical protein